MDKLDKVLNTLTNSGYAIQKVRDSLYEVAHVDEVYRVGCEEVWLDGRHKLELYISQHGDEEAGSIAIEFIEYYDEASRTTEIVKLADDNYNIQVLRVVQQMIMPARRLTLFTSSMPF